MECGVPTRPLPTPRQSARHQPARGSRGQFCSGSSHEYDCLHQKQGSEETIRHVLCAQRVLAETDHKVSGSEETVINKNGFPVIERLSNVSNDCSKELSVYFRSAFAELADWFIKLV